MKKLTANLHIFIILYALVSIYFSYEEYSLQLEEKKNSIPAIQGQISRQKKKLKEVRSYYKDIEDAKERIELVAQEVEKVQRKLPDKVSDTENLQLIKRIAEEIKLKNIFLTPALESDRGFYILKEYEFKATGTYLQFVRFFERIGESERLLNVNSIDFSKGSRQQRGRFQVINAKTIIGAYLYNSNYKESRGVEEIEKEFSQQKNNKGKK